MGRMRIALVLFLMLLLGLSGTIYAVGIATSKHDFRASGGGHAVSGVNQICKNCHVPHTAPYNAYRRLLWLQTAYPGASITMWNNADLWYSQGFGGANKGIKGPPATTLGNYGDLTTSDRAESSIHFCMSCHADGAFYAPGATTQQQTFASPLIAVDLTKTHPVNVVYESAFTGINIGAGLVKPTDPDVVLVRGVNGDTMVCRTCHDPHNRPANEKFLTLGVNVSNPAQSNYLCMHCHPTDP